LLFFVVIPSEAGILLPDDEESLFDVDIASA
jgi:hypothetical protein